MCSWTWASATPNSARPSSGLLTRSIRSWMSSTAQAAAAARLGLNQPKVSALRNYKLEGFSVERLMTLLNALDRDVEIVIRAKPRSRAAARISVVAG